MQLADRDISSRPAASQEPAARARFGSARRLRPDEVQAVVAGYEAGKTMKELAAEFAISRQTVSTHLRRADTPIRREGIERDKAAEAEALYQAGWTSRDIADRFDVSPDTVLRALRRQGVVIRSRHSPTAPRRR